MPRVMDKGDAALKCCKYGSESTQGLECIDLGWGVAGWLGSLHEVRSEQR